MISSYCVELNLSDDPITSSSWNIDCIENALSNNFENACLNKGDHWQIIALASSSSEAYEMVDVIWDKIKTARRVSKNS